MRLSSQLTFGVDFSLKSHSWVYNSRDQEHRMDAMNQISLPAEKTLRDERCKIVSGRRMKALGRTTGQRIIFCNKQKSP